MSLVLTSNDAHKPNSGYPGAGRTVAAAELRLRSHIAVVNDLLDALFVHTDEVLGDHNRINLEAYRQRIARVNSAHGDLELSVNRLSELIFVGADTLLITIGRSVCETLTRILESAQAHVAAIEDGA